MSTSYFASSDIDHIVASLPTPVFITDAHVVRQQMQRLNSALPFVRFFYSIKTNPHPIVIDTLLEFPEVAFDAATLGEIDLALARGITPQNILYSHPVSSVAEIGYAVQKEVSLFTFDNLAQLQRLETHAPHASYLLRFAPSHNSSLYDYKRKFGATPDEITAMLDYAVSRSLPVAGISFMVGSQSMDTLGWQAAFQQAASIINAYYQTLPSLRVVNMGSGFPLQYGFADTVPSLASIARIAATFKHSLPTDVQLIAEPGRIIAGPASVLVTEVFQRVDRQQGKWLYVDANAYSGPIEIIESGGTLPYPISSRRRGATTEFVVAGKTLDPDDIFAKKASLSQHTATGDLLMLHDMGAYTHSFFTDYHSLPQPIVYVVDSQYRSNVQLSVGGMEITGLSARRDLPRGEKLFEVTGYFYPERTRTTFQVRPNRHIEPTQFGAYLNHSCQPNAGVRSNQLGHYDIVALRDIQAGEEITADYAMFEYETGPMSRVGCLCGAAACRRKITGYKDLPAAQKKAYQGFIADYLLALPARPRRLAAGMRLKKFLNRAD